jgi:hypothetical protein
VEAVRLERKVVRVFASHAEAERHEEAWWRALSPEQRLDAAWQCVQEYLWLKNEPEQRLRRVHRVLERKRS